MIGKEVKIKLDNEPSIPLKLQFNPNMSEQLVNALTIQAIENIALGYGYRGTVQVSDVTDKAHVYTTALPRLHLGTQSTVHLHLHLHSDDLQNTLDHFRPIPPIQQPQPQPQPQQDFNEEFYSCNEHNNDKFYDCRDLEQQNITPQNISISQDKEKDIQLEQEKQQEIEQEKQKQIEIQKQIDIEKQKEKEIQQQKLKEQEQRQQRKRDHIIFNTSSVDLKSEDGADTKILSTTRSRGLFSYLPKNQPYDKLYPPPVYMQMNSLPNKKYVSREKLLEGLQINSNGEIKLVDQKILDRFKGLMSEMIKKISQSISEGRGMIGVSLPVRIFEARSTIERITDCWGYATRFLSDKLHMHPTLTLEQKVENVKNVMLFGVAGLSLSLSMLKPFNPLLGETYQGEFADGGQLMIEHISHHPPISTFHLEHKDYRLQGYYEYKASNNATFNQITLNYLGPNILTLKHSGQIIKYNMPDIKMAGMIWGDRLTRYKKYMLFTDQANNIKATVNFGLQKQPNGKMSKKQTDQIYGKVYSFKNYRQKGMKEEEVEKMVDLEKEWHEVTGSYLGEVMVDGQLEWSMYSHPPSMVTPIRNPLPSDWRFREDLIWMHYQDYPKSEKWKVKLEEEQRSHRKLRLTYNKKKNKHK